MAAGASARARRAASRGRARRCVVGVARGAADGRARIGRGRSVGRSRSVGPTGVCANSARRVMTRHERLLRLRRQHGHTTKTRARGSHPRRARRPRHARATPRRARSTASIDARDALESRARAERERDATRATRRGDATRRRGIPRTTASDDGGARTRDATRRDADGDDARRVERCRSDWCRRECCRTCSSSTS